MHCPIDEILKVKFNYEPINRIGWKIFYQLQTIKRLTIYFTLFKIIIIKPKDPISLAHICSITYLFILIVSLAL